MYLVYMQCFDLNFALSFLLKVFFAICMQSVVSTAFLYLVFTHNIWWGLGLCICLHIFFFIIPQVPAFIRIVSVFGLYSVVISFSRFLYLNVSES